MNVHLWDLCLSTVLGSEYAFTRLYAFIPQENCYCIVIRGKKRGLKKS